MEHKNLQIAIGLYVISEMLKESSINLIEFRQLRSKKQKIIYLFNVFRVRKALIEARHCLIDAIFLDFDPSDSQIMKNRFLDLIGQMPIDQKNTSSSSWNSEDSSSSITDDVYIF
jgi:hypothetical protein